jgi:hypothetical protein
MFQHPLQHQFPPVALGFLPLQGAGQVGRFIAQALIELLQTFKLLTQGEALTGFLMVALLDAFFEGLDAFLERIEQLAKALLAGLGKALLALVEDLPGQLGELRTQLIARALQVVQALLVATLLLAQLGTQGRALGAQATQFGFLLLTLLLPGQGGLTGDLPLVLQQFGLAPLGRQLGLLVGLDLADLGQFLAAFIELRTQTSLRQLRIAQALL